MHCCALNIPVPRDLLMQDFMSVETSQFPSKGGHQVCQKISNLNTTCAILIPFLTEDSFMFLSPASDPMGKRYLLYRHNLRI